jgi:uncharacterized protein YndB with AHSA1/START domain
MSSPIVKEVLLNAPVARVWRAITSRDELSQWSFDMPAFEPVVGFDFEFYGEKDGQKFRHLCRVVSVVPEKSMTWRWTYEDVPGETFVHFELTPQGNQTFLKLTHEGLENLPQDELYGRANFEMGWNELIGVLLVKHLER